MRAFILTLALSSGVAASAQMQSIQPEPQQHSFPTPSVQAPPLFHPSPSDPTCPTDLTASRRGKPVTLWTISQQDASDPAFQRNVMGGLAGSGVHVHLSPSMLIQMPRSILRAELAVDYLAPGVRAVPISQHNDPPTLSKTFTVHAGTLPSATLNADLLIGESAGIVRVHLVSLIFTDGSGWTAPSTSACSTTPSLYVPVSH